MQTELIRTSLKTARSSLSANQRLQASRLLCHRIAHIGAFRVSKIIALYFPVNTEIDISELFERARLANKTIVLPVVTDAGLRFAPFLPGDRLVDNQFGIPEPWHIETGISPRKIDLVVTPLLGFDTQCHRIGMGGGFYDRTFGFLRNRRHWFRPKLLGVGFECQKVDLIRPQPWDISMWCVATEAAIYKPLMQRS